MPFRLSSVRKVSHIRRRIGEFLLGVVLAALALLWWQHNAVHDWIVLRSYTPPTAIKRIAQQDTMTVKAKNLFYINKPTIENNTAFAKDCPQGTEKTIVLGCYTGNESGIYVLKVTDPRLYGIEQVTSAHEMLHAAYTRLSSSEKKKVDGMLLDYYEHDLTDPRIKATMEAYRKSEPNDVVNEMHSVFGTEIAKLPSGLEDYYKQYFINRQVVVTNFAAQYQQAFTSRQEAIDQDEQQLAILKNQIEAKKASLSEQLTILQQQQTQLNQERDNGNIDAYNAGVISYNQKVSTYKDGVQMLKSLISQYNALVQQHNKLVLQGQQLVQELQGSSVQAAP